MGTRICVSVLYLCITVCVCVCAYFIRMFCNRDGYSYIAPFVVPFEVFWV